MVALPSGAIHGPRPGLLATFTANRSFWKSPLVIKAARGHHDTTDDGRQLRDGFSGVWTSGLGHCHPAIVAAVQEQIATLDYSMGSHVADDLERVVALYDASNIAALIVEPVAASTGILVPPPG